MHLLEYVRVGGISAVIGGRHARFLRSFSSRLFNNPQNFT